MFVHEMCNDVLKVSMGTGDIEKMFRLVDGKKVRLDPYWSGSLTLIRKQV